MTRHLWEFIEQALAGAPAPPGHLPLVHSTDLLRFHAIRSGGALDPKPCPVYKEKLLYFFYGRPSYRPHSRTETVSVMSFAPVCMVFARDVAAAALRILPFDSGAFAAGRMNLMHPDMKLADFELEANSEAPMKLIQFFYGTEAAYVNERPVEVGGINECADFHVDAYNKTIRIGGNGPLDERVSSIEVQVNHKVPVDKQLQAVILPAAYLDVDGVRDQIDGWGATAIPYKMTGTFQPRQLHGVIVDKLITFLNKKGCV